jgi:hypothetical protein
MEHNHPMRKVILRIAITVIGLVVVVVVAAGLYLFWYTHRPLPEVITDRPLFQGITYTRQVRHEPRPLVVHIVKIALDTPGIRFLVTPGDDIDGYDYTARTTSQFLDEFDVQLAINADGFAPWWERGIFDYYPHQGDGTNPIGLTVSQGEMVRDGARNDQVLYTSEDNRVSFSPPPGELYNVVSGLHNLVRDGVYALTSQDSYVHDLHPRTAVGLTEDERTLILVIVDGRQPNYSEGVSLPELAQILIDAGAYSGINLDGGGSSALVMEGEDGKPVQLGSAIHTRIPGRERPVANHLGVFADGLP